MSEEGLQDANGGIRLFSPPGRKRKRASSHAAPGAVTAQPPSTPATETAGQQDSAEPVIKPAADQGAAASTSQADDDSGEQQQGFQSLGVSEWLDRCAPSTDDLQTCLRIVMSSFCRHLQRPQQAWAIDPSAVSPMGCSAISRHELKS